MNHIGFLIDRANEPEGGACGHALMMSCPTFDYEFVDDEGIVSDMPSDAPFGPVHLHNGTSQKTWDIPNPDLSALLNLSKTFNLEGEVTPVMAWGMLLAHERFSELTVEDFHKMCQELVGKARCYGSVN